jgi:hypothetical protein
MHLTYAGKMVDACQNGLEKARGCDCSGNDEWISMLGAGYSPFNWPKLAAS